MRRGVQMDMRTSCPWDVERLESMGISDEHALAVIDMLLQQGQKTIAAMQLAPSDMQVQEWRRAAHGLAGSALNLGMQPLAAYCQQDVESTATEAQRHALCEAIRTELQRIAAYKQSLEH